MDIVFSRRNQAWFISEYKNYFNFKVPELTFHK